MPRWLVITSQMNKWPLTSYSYLSVSISLSLSLSEICYRNKDLIVKEAAVWDSLNSLNRGIFEGGRFGSEQQRPCQFRSLCRRVSFEIWWPACATHGRERHLNRPCSVYVFHNTCKPPLPPSPSPSHRLLNRKWPCAVDRTSEFNYQLPPTPPHSSSLNFNIHPDTPKKSFSYSSIWVYSIVSRPTIHSDASPSYPPPPNPPTPRQPNYSQ